MKIPNLLLLIALPVHLASANAFFSSDDNKPLAKGTVISQSIHGEMVLDLIVPSTVDSFSKDEERLRAAEGSAVVTLNGTPCPAWFVGHGGGQTPDGQGRVIDFDLRFRPGAPGKKKLKIELGDRSAVAEFDYEPQAWISWKNTDQEEAFFGSSGGPDRELRDVLWDGDNLKNDSVQVTLNGAIQVPLTQTSSLDPNILEGTLKQASMQEGHNLAAISGTDVYGNTLSAKIDFYLFSNNQVPEGTVFNLRLGKLGTKMGPFYSAALTGTALVEEGGDIMRNFAFARIRALYAGKGIVSIIKGHFRRKTTEISKLSIDVTKKPDQP